jgi:AcrR family transcriptional regulator
MTDVAALPGQARGAVPGDGRAHRSDPLITVVRVRGVPALTPPGDPLPGRGGRPRDPSRDAAIRAAILEVLGREGYAGLTMDAVAAEAGVGKATIYRRWRTKAQLVADAVASLDGDRAPVPDTGSLEEDLRHLLRWLVTTVNGPLGAATRALLSEMPHQPELRAAFDDGPVGRWHETFREVWSRAERRGEVRPGLLGSAVAASASGPILQRWLFGGQPVDHAFADEVLVDVVLALVRTDERATG